MIKKILVGVLIAVVLIVGVLALIIALQPSHYEIERSTTINAPANIVYDQVNDFHKWEAWSPWAKLDPNMKQEYLGAPVGVGAIYKWAGNNQVGEGKMTITMSIPPNFTRIKLEFIKPFAAISYTDFNFTQQGDQTLVKWKMMGDNNFLGKAFSLVMNMDKTVGPDFERGLAQLKVVSESAAKFN